MKKKLELRTKWIAVLPLIGICGCTGIALDNDYAGYSKVYADSSNKQLLLNLARESHQEPIYFIQLASISSQYQFSTSGGFMPSASKVSPASISGAAGGLVQHTLTFGGSLNAGATQTPIFYFLPLTGSNFVQTILSPISDKVFWTFYDQGWPADWVARTMLNSVRREFDETNANQALTNSHFEIYFNDPTDPTYPEFLKYCNDLYNAQQFHILEVDKAESNNVAVLYKSTNASLKDIVAAITAGLNVEYDTNYYIVQKNDDTAKFLVKPNEDSQIREFYHQYVFYTNKLLDAKMSVTNALSFAEDFKAKRIILTTRTFEETMNAIANEEQFFKDYEQPANLPYTNCITFTNDPYGTIAIVTPSNSPAFATRPILMIEYTNSTIRSRISELAEVEYEGHVYSIGDLKETYKDPMEHFLKDFYPYRGDDVYYQNCTVFSMLSYLFSQATIDTSKLPVQQLIQVQ